MTVLDWLPAAPETTAGVRPWFIVMSVIYLLVRKSLALPRGHAAPTDMARLSDAATFAGSVLLLVGIVDAGTLRAIGDATAFLIIAGVGGVFYSGEQLLEEW